MDYPDYFDLPAGSELSINHDFGYGPGLVNVKTQQDMGCYSLKAQADALAIKKGNK